MATLLKKLGIDHEYLELRKKEKEQKKAEKKAAKAQKKEKKNQKAGANGNGSLPIPPPPVQEEEVYDFADVDSSSGEEDTRALPSARSSVVSVAASTRGKSTLKQRYESMQELEQHVNRLSSEKIELIAAMEQKEREWKRIAEEERRLREEERKRREEEAEAVRQAAEKAKREEDERLQNHHGFMSKKGHVRHNWKQRWFQLDFENGFVAYYEDERCAKQKGKINLRAGATLQSTEHRDRQFCFIVKEAGGKEYFLSSGSKEELQHWTTAIGNAIRKFHNADLAPEAQPAR